MESLLGYYEMAETSSELSIALAEILSRYSNLRYVKTKTEFDALLNNLKSAGRKIRHGRHAGINNLEKASGYFALATDGYNLIENIIAISSFTIIIV